MSQWVLQPGLWYAWPDANDPGSWQVVRIYRNPAGRYEAATLDDKGQAQPFDLDSAALWCPLHGPGVSPFMRQTAASDKATP